MRKHDRPEGRLRWLVAGLAVFAVLAGGAFVRETVRSRQIDHEIEALQNEAERLRVRNFQISALESSLSSGEFLEREARMKLGLQKEGEQAVVIRKEETRAAAGAAEAEPPKPWSNTKKWWTYFTDPEAFRDYAATVRAAEDPAPRPR
ncbi:MAG TPA: septum formation initiator family protein [Candidatus Baltobacteraceae bacterium]|jgi:cell division protein FtsB|nr:septum formation initiator family protein [Candidatus Baltobacteraceae bacterium]